MNHATSNQDVDIYVYTHKYIHIYIHIGMFTSICLNYLAGNSR